MSQKLVLDGQDETGAGLGAGVAVLGFHHLPRLGVVVVQAVRFPLDAVTPCDAGVEPLGGVGRPHLGKQGEDQLVIKNLPLIVVGDDTLGLEGVGPKAHHPVRYLAHAVFMANPARHAAAAEVLAGDDVACVLGVLDREFQVIHLQDGLPGLVVEQRHIYLLPLK